MKKLLLLSDVPPCSNLTGGIVLGQLCRFVRPDALACFAVLNPYLQPEPFKDLDWLPVRTVTKPNEFGVRRKKGVPIGPVGAYTIETIKRRFLTPRLVRAAAEFAREQDVGAIWAVLQGQTIIRMAVPLSRMLGVPLYTQVWDPLSWWLAAHEVDPINARLAGREFDRALRESRVCAAASWAMAELYQARYGTRSVPVIAGHEEDVGARPATALRAGGDLVLGMAGQFYASDEWEQLVAALGRVDWHVAGRRVRLKVLGRDPPHGDIPSHCLDYVGWKDQAQTIRTLSEETDVLYCPYPFAPNMEEVARLSFPSKLTTYFAAGRPVLFHGPAYASPSRYLETHEAGLLCNALDGSSVVACLERLVETPGLYPALARAGQQAFLRDFTMRSMRASFRSFLENGEFLAAAPEGPPPHPHHGPFGAAR